MEETESLPRDLHDLLHNHIKEMSDLRKKYKINYGERTRKLYTLEEVDLSEFDKPYNYRISPNYFISVDKLPNIISFLCNLTPELNILVPEYLKNKVLKLANIGTDKSKTEVLEEVLLKYNLKLEKSSIIAEVLELDFGTFTHFAIPEIDSIQFNSLNYCEKEGYTYLKDVSAEDLEYFYYFQTKQHLKIVNANNIKINFIKLDISNKEIIDKQLTELFNKNRILTIEQDFITINEFH